MSDTAPHAVSAKALDSTSDSQLIEQLDDSSADVRQKILASRQKKRAQASVDAAWSSTDASDSSADRLTWFGVDDDVLRPPSSTESRRSNRAESRNSDQDEEEDADSTVLGHYVSALPLPPPKSMLVQHTRFPPIQSTSQPLFASEDTLGSSHESNSRASYLLEDDTDAHSSHVTAFTDGSSASSSRRTSSVRASTGSRRASQNASGKDLAGGNAASSSSKSLGPPPSAPLPPKPLTSPHSPFSPTGSNGELWSSRRSSHASARTAASSRSSTSVRSSWKSSNPSLASSRLVPTPSERSDTSDLSDDDLIGIRNISKQFPSPATALSALPPSLSQVLERTSSLASHKSRSASEASRASSLSQRPGSAAHRQLSPSAETSLDLPVDTPHAREKRLDSIKGEESSDSALSDVLNLTDHMGILRIGKRLQKPSLQQSVGVASVGLGARTLSRTDSQQLLRLTKRQQREQTRETSTGEVASSSEDSQRQHTHHKRSSTMSKSMSELVAALDLEASEWGQRLGTSESTEFDSPLVNAAQARESQLLDTRPTTSHLSQQSDGDAPQHKLPASDSMPSLSPSGSQDVSLDESRGPATAESSLIRSNSVKSHPSLRDSTGTADDLGASAEFRSIYEAYRRSTSTIASRFTAPVVRIEGPEGDEVSVSGSESDSDLSSSDAVPRKRNKPSRRNRLGFEEQRAALRPRPSVSVRSASLSTKPSQTFRSTLVPTQEEDTSDSTSAPTTITLGETDPYAFYEFSPSLPPFMPTGLSPRDLTGRGTWSSIVARASEHVRTRHPSVASLASTFAAADMAPVSMRQIRAAARAKQKQIDAAHRAREEMSDQIAAMSYRPFAIHDHALTFANHAGMSADVRRSVSSAFSIGSPEGLPSGRSSSMSSPGYAESVAPSVGDYGTLWPVAVGADQGVGPDDALSMYSMTPYSLSRRSSARQPQEAKKYVEFCMQTSPQPSPTESQFPISDTLTVDDAVNLVDAEVGSDSRPARDDLVAAPRSKLAYLGTDAPMRRRKSAASLLSMYSLEAELDQPGLWPSRIRAPRLSSYERRRGHRESTVGAALGQESGSDEESDLDVSANLEDLAERSGVLDTLRGSKRKLRSATKDAPWDSSYDDGVTRPIASIPARSRRISDAIDRIRAQRISRSAGWADSDDEDDCGFQEGLNIPRTPAASSRPSLPGSVPAKVASSANLLRRSKSMASMDASKNQGSSPSLLRVRSPSPDLSILTNPSEDEEVLLTADFELDAAELSHRTVLDEEFDMMVGQTITSRFSGTVQPKSRSASDEAGGRVARPWPQRSASGDGSDSCGEDGGEASPEASKDSQQTVQLHTRSRTSSMSSVIEIIQEADELLSSTGHSIGHSSGHDTNISDSGGTSGHDPQRPNQVLADIIRRRLSMRLQGLQTPATLVSSRFVQSNGSLVKADPETVDVQAGAVEEEIMSPSMQDTPDTMAGSEIWSSFHADRSSSASTATTWSYRSSEDVQPRVLASKTANDKESGTPAVSKTAETSEQIDSTVSAASSDQEKPALLRAGRSIPVLRRKSSGLPVASAASLKLQSRPSLPLPPKSDPEGLLPVDDGSSSSAIPIPKPTTRRYQSVATLRDHASDVSRTTSGVSDAALPLKQNGADKNGRGLERYSDGFQQTPSKPIRGMGGGITPSKLPSLRNTVSTTSLRTRAAASQGANVSPQTKAPTGVKEKLPVPRAAARSRLPSPSKVQASGLPRAAPRSA